MIKHVVMMKLIQPGNKEDFHWNMLKLKSDLEELADKIPELNSIEVGINISTAPESYNMVLNCEFDNRDDLEKYRTHPDHLDVLKFFHQVVEKSIVIDYEV